MTGKIWRVFDNSAIVNVNVNVNIPDGFNP